MFSISSRLPSGSFTEITKSIPLNVPLVTNNEKFDSVKPKSL